MLKRQVKFDRIERASENGDLIIDMAFASEEPVERWWGIEILDMNNKSVRLDRLNDGASVLFNHNPDDLRGVHVAGSVSVDKDKVLRGRVRLTSATQTGRDTIALVESKMLTKASIGYIIHEVTEVNKGRSGDEITRNIDGRMFEDVLQRSIDSRNQNRTAFYRNLDAEFGSFNRKDNEPSLFRVIDFEPIENSLVTIPADKTVGIGRSKTEDTDELRMLRSSKPADAAKEESMTPEEEKIAAEAARVKDEERAAKEAEAKIRNMNAVEMETGRKKAITQLCHMNKLDDKFRDMWIGQGLSLEHVAEELLKVMEERGKSNPKPASMIGMTHKEAEKFSLRRAILACKDNDWRNAPFELECSRAVATKLNVLQEPTKFFIPFEVLQGDPTSREKRDATAAGSAGYLVATNNVGFIEILRNRSVAFRMGVRRLSGLTGNVTIPKQTVAATAYWLANESTAITEGNQTFVQVALTPKTVGAYTEVSRQLLLQSDPSAEAIVSNDLAAQVATAADLAVLNGSGTEQPTGIIQTSGIGAVTGTSLAYAGILEFQTDVAGANVIPMAGGYVTTPAVAGLLSARARFSNTDTPLWDGNIWDAKMAGFPAMSSLQMPSATMLFGDWSEVVVGEWGVLEIEINPYANFAAGIIGVRAIYSMDVAVRRAAAFSYASSIT